MGVENTASPKRTIALDIAFCLLLAAAHLALTFQFQPPCVETFDMAIALDGGYRVYCGQMPYRDFHIPTGPMRHYTLGLCYLVTGGFSWWATILWAGLIGSTASVLVFYVVRVFGGRIYAMLFAGLTALTFNLPVAFPWFDHEAFLWSLAALAAFAHVHAIAEPSLRRVLVGTALSGFALALSVMSKQNIGGASLILVSLLWLTAPFQTRTFLANIAAASSVVAAALITIAAFILFFEWQGQFLNDVLTSGSQMKRLFSAAAGLGLDIANWPWRDSIDVWTALLTLLMLVCLRLCGIRLTRRQWTIILLALCALGINIAGRLTGSAPRPWFCALIPLALGLLTCITRRPDPRPASILRIALALALVVALVLMWSYAPTLVVERWPDLAEAIEASHAPNFDDYTWCFKIAVLVYGLSLGTRLCLTRDLRLSPLSIARPLLFIAAATLACFYPIYIKDHQGWTYSPAAWGDEFVPFTKIPTLAGCRAKPQEVHDFEELYDWWQSHRPQFSGWRQGQDLFILPNSQQFYALLGEESFRNVRLWYDPGLTYLDKDPDTDVLEKTLPMLMVMQVDGRDYQFQWWTSASILYEMPRFEQLLNDRYAVIDRLEGFVIWGRKN